MNMNVDLNSLLKQAKEMQSKMQSAQEALAKIVVTGESGGGLVKVDMDGRHTVRSIWLGPSLLKENKEVIEELLASAFNSALGKVEKASHQKLSDLTSQLQTKFSDDSTET